MAIGPPTTRHHESFLWQWWSAIIIISPDDFWLSKPCRWYQLPVELDHAISKMIMASHFPACPLMLVMFMFFTDIVCLVNWKASVLVLTRPLKKLKLPVVRSGAEVIRCILGIPIPSHPGYSGYNHFFQHWSRASGPRPPTEVNMVVGKSIKMIKCHCCCVCSFIPQVFVTLTNCITNLDSPPNNREKNFNWEWFEVLWGIPVLDATMYRK